MRAEENIKAIESVERKERCKYLIKPNRQSGRVGVEVEEAPTDHQRQAEVVWEGVPECMTANGPAKDIQCVESPMVEEVV